MLKKIGKVFFRTVLILACIAWLAIVVGLPYFFWPAIKAFLAQWAPPAGLALCAIIAMGLVADAFGSQKDSITYPH